MRGIVPALGLVLALIFTPGPWSAYAQERPSVHAEQGGIAAGGSVIGNTINQENPETLKLLAKSLADKDVSEEKHREAEVKMAELAAKLGFTSQAVTRFFEILGEQNVPEEKAPLRLIEIATRFAATRDQLAALEPDDPHAAELAKQAKDALDKGQLAEADALLGRAMESEAAAFREAGKLKQQAQEAEDKHALNLAKMEASQGNIALTQWRYTEAAQRFAEAAAKVPAGHEDERWKYLTAEAEALYRQGDEFGDNDAAALAIERYRHLAELRPRNAFPQDWAATQNNLGNALSVLGAREGGTARLGEAVAAYREALQERTRERVPLRWAMTQNNLGGALFRLGKQESGTARLTEAVAAYRKALQERTRARVPLEWAMTQMNLGNALKVLGEREGGTARLEEAVAAFGEALQEYTRERVPLDWAMTQMNLGIALRALGKREGGSARLEEAVAAFREALQELTRARVPLEWATTQMNLGNALATLGEPESGTARLEEAVAAYREALQEETRARVPLEWAKSTGNQGVALMLLAERRHDAKTAKLALQQIEAALATSRDGGDAPTAAFCEAQLPKARALAQKLAKR
jgi:tetratricopeptide (TPR) repeat protein